MFKSKLNFYFDENALPGEIVVFLVETQEEDFQGLQDQIQLDEDLRSEWLAGNCFHEDSVE